MSKKIESLQNIAFNFLAERNNQNFKFLIDRLKPGLRKFAFNYVKDNDLTEEVLQQTFMAIWQKIDQYKVEYNFSTWAYAIAKNEALGILRSGNKNVSYDMYSENHSKVLQAYTPVYTMETECMGPIGDNLIQELVDASLSAIHSLNEPYKTVMIEREVNLKQLNDIAQDLGWELSTVKTRLRKARKDVAEVLYKKYPDLVDSYYGKENEQ